MALTAPTLYAVRTVQVRRNAGILLDRAAELEKQGDFNTAAQTLFRYLQFRSDDGLARVLLAEVYDKAATTFAAKKRATEHYQRALAYFEDRLDLRTRLAELLFELGQCKEAETECLRVLFGAGELTRADVMSGLKSYQDRLQANKLLANNADAAKALRILAQACFQSADRSWSPNDQMTAVTTAMAVNPQSIELALLQAKLYRERMSEPDHDARVRMADDVIAQTVDKHPNAAQAQLAVYRYRIEYQIDGADEALNKALAAGPDDYEVLLTAAEHAIAQGQSDNASIYSARLCEKFPLDPRGYTGLAHVYFKQGKTAEGIAVCRKGIKRCGEDEVTLDLVLLGGLIEDGKLAEADAVLVGIKRKQEVIGPQLKLSERTKLRDEIALLEAQYAIESKKPLRAVAILRELTIPRSGEQRQADDLRVRGQRWRRLGQVYELLQYWELAAKAYQEEAALRTANYSALVSASRAWQAAGRLELATAALVNAQESTDAQPQGWIALARAEMERQMRLTNPDWSKTDHALREATRLLGDSPSVGILTVELLRAKGDHSAALHSLARLIDAYPEEALPFACLLYQSMGDKDRAVGCLNRLKDLQSSSPRDIKVLEVELCRRQKNYDRCKTLLEELIAESKDSGEYDWRRQYALVELERSAEAGERQLKALASAYPADPWALERLANLALAKHDYDNLAKYDTELEKLEGNDGALWRFYRAMRLLGQNENGNDDDLEKALRLHKELQSLRPGWASTLHLEGLLAQQQGRVEESAEAYKAAIEAGETSVTVFEGLITLLYANNRWLEADAFLSRLQQVGYQSPILDSFASRVLLRQGEFDQAILAARSGIKRRPKSAIAHIWLGQTLVIASNSDSDQAVRQEKIREAKNAMEQAIALAPDDFRTWSGLLWFSVRLGDQESGARALDGLRAKAKLTEPQRMLALGQAYQLLRDFERAEEMYVRAAQLLPRDSATHERLAQFYLIYSPERAEEAFRRVLELSPNSKSARRALATILVTQGAGSQFGEALTLLRDSGEDATDRRLQALFLIQRGGQKNRQQARRILEELLSHSPTPNPMDRHLLAVSAEADGDLITAREQLERLATSTNSVNHLAALIDFLVRQNQHQEAASHLTRLVELEPSSFRTTQTKINWMKAAGRSDIEIKQAIERFGSEALASATDEELRLRAISRVAVLFTQSGMLPEAKRAFRGFLQQHSSDRARQTFALWLVRNDQISDAVEFATQEVARAAPVPTGSVQLLCNILTVAAGRGLRFTDAENRIDQLVRDQAQDANILFELATLKHMLDEYAMARRLYEQSIQLAPGNAFAHNNLAMLLLDRRGNMRESLYHIEEALRIAGPVPELRDTYAVVLTHNGRADEASRILRTLLSHSPRNSRYLFHLALAYEKADDRAGAADVLNKAKENDLEVESMTPVERKLLLELTRKLIDPH